MAFDKLNGVTPTLILWQGFCWWGTRCQRMICWIFRLSRFSRLKSLWLVIIQIRSIFPREFCWRGTGFQRMTCSKERTESTGTGQTSTSGRSSRFTGERCSTSRNVLTKNQNNKGGKLKTWSKYFPARWFWPAVMSSHAPTLPARGWSSPPWSPPPSTPTRCPGRPSGPRGRGRSTAPRTPTTAWSSSCTTTGRCWGTSPTLRPLSLPWARLTRRNTSSASSFLTIPWRCVPILKNVFGLFLFQSSKKKVVFSGSRCAGQLRVQRSRHLPKIPQKATSSKNQVFAQENLQHLVFALPPRI